jgi:N-acetylneuraminic acid mutarotase
MNSLANKIFIFGLLACLGSLIASSVLGAENPPCAHPALEKRTSLGFNRLFPGVEVVHGKIYIFGGHTRIGNRFRPTAEFEEYDPQTNTVKQLPNLPSARSLFGSVVIGNEIYVIGGTGDKPGSASSQVDAYDTAKGTWSNKAFLNVPRAGLRAAVLGGKIYTFGGYKDKGCVVEVYDIKTNTWSRLDDAAHSILNPSIAVHDGRIYIVGGGTPDGAKAKGVIQVMNGSTGKMNCLGDLPIPKGDHTVGFHQDRMYVMGGWNDMVLKSIEVYDLKTKVWSTRPDLPHPLHYHGMVLVKDRFYIVGGALSGDLASESVYSKAVYLYDPSR